MWFKACATVQVFQRGCAVGDCVGCPRRHVFPTREEQWAVVQGTRRGSYIQGGCAHREVHPLAYYTAPLPWQALPGAGDFCGGRGTGSGARRAKARFVV